MRSRVLRGWRNVGEGKIRQAPVERILRNSGDSQRAGNVVLEGVEILRAGAVAVEVGANDVGQLADAARVGDGNVEAADGRAAADAGKRIGEVGARSVVVKAEESDCCEERCGRRPRRPRTGAAPKVRFTRMFRSSLSLVAEVT